MSKENEAENNLPDKDTNSSIFSISGVDTEKGLALTGGTEEFYRRVLELFHKDALERLPRLQTVPESDALKNFITQTHSLKSASASIGAEGLSAEAAALEAAGKKGDLAFIKDNLTGFNKHLTELTGYIRAALEPAQAPNPESPNPAIPYSYSPLLINLQTALKSQNAVEIDNILNELNQKQLDSKTKETLEEISDNVLMTEFGAALKKIEELLNTNK